MILFFFSSELFFLSVLSFDKVVENSWETRKDLKDLNYLTGEYAAFLLLQHLKENVFILLLWKIAQHLLDQDTFQ